MNGPDLSGSFPLIVPDVKISSDLQNRAHGPHFDMMQSIPGGVDQVRIGPDGTILGGETNIGKAPMSWGDK